jgi:hypothetical protein
MGGKASVAAATAQIEDWGQLNTFLGEASATKGVTGTLARAVSRGSTRDGTVSMGPEDAQVTARDATSASTETTSEVAKEAPADLIVVAGGNLALIYFNASDERMMLEEISELYPDLVEALANHPGIGILIVRSAAHGLICVGQNGIHYLDEERVEGEDPLTLYGDIATRAIKRLDEIEHVGDICVVSLYDPETEEIAAFEELIGAHGGLGGPQTRPFLLYPADWELDLAPLFGAPMVYQQLRRWMEGELGMKFGPQAASAAATAAVATPATAAAATAAPPA